MKVLYYFSIICLLSASSLGDENPLEKIQKELNEVKKQNELMRSEIEELKESQQKDTWMDEARALELRNLVSDVLKDADTRDSFENDSIMAGWSNGFFLTSRDGRFKINVGGLFQARYLSSYFSRQQSQYSNLGNSQSGNDRYRGGFEIPRAMLRFSGHVFGKKNKYFVEFGRQNSYETAGTSAQGGALPTLGLTTLEMGRSWLELALTEDWSAKVGRMRSPYSMEWLIDPDVSLGVDRSLVSMKLGLSDATGIQAIRQREDDRIQFMISTTMPGGFFSQNQAEYFYNKGSQGIGALDRNNTDWTMIGRYSYKYAGTWSQFNQFTSPPDEEFGLMAGMGGYYLRWQEESGSTTGDPKTKEWGLTADVMGKWGGLSGYGAAYYTGYDGSRGNPRGHQKVFGALLQGSVYSDPKNEYFARVEYADVQSDNQLSATYTVDPDPKTDLALFTLGWNHYIDGQDLKLSAEVGWSIDEVSALWVNDHLGWRSTKDDGDQMVFRSQFQLRF